jgi:phytoene/squalene synthetase
MNRKSNSNRMQTTANSQSLAAAITKSASKQTYYTFRIFADRDRVDDAYRAYGYFRWVDDVLDAGSGNQDEKVAFINHQVSLLEACYRGETPDDLCPEEWMLVDLVRNDTEKHSGLQTYLREMMGVMVFDVQRRSRLITQAELTEYTRLLATAVTEALYYFIGHGDPSPCPEVRYLAVTAAHITHMLRDTYEDIEAGYFNVPREVLQSHGMAPGDVNSQAYREWVTNRVHMARRYFDRSRECMAQVKNLRCRLAGYAYTARFEWVLGAIERDDYYLRPDYSERKSLRAALWMGWKVLSSVFLPPWKKTAAKNLTKQHLRVDEQ